MRLEDLTVTLRPRKPWEAVDLGCALVRRDFGRLFALWSATVFPLWLIVCLALHQSPHWIPIVVWWLKPLYDRVPLFFLSRATFGVRLTFKETLKAWPRLWLSSLFRALFWRRFSFIRSFAMPAQMLEGLRGSAVSRRVKALALDGGSSGVMLTFAALTLETGLWIGLLWSTDWLLPEITGVDFQTFFGSLSEAESPPSPLSWWIAFTYMGAISLNELFYVGAGFGLYLNSRTRVEGWDVEIIFRRIGARLAAPVLVVLLMFASLFAAATDVRGDDVKGQAPAVIREVLESEDFKVHKETAKRWVRDKKETEQVVEQEATAPNFDVPMLVGQVLFWSIVVAFVGWLIWYLVKNRHLFQYTRTAPKVAPLASVVMGMNITRESLPADIVAAARQAWAAGDFKEALSLLYRGSLSWLVLRRRVPISDSDTEEECLQHVVTFGPQQEADYFRQLTGAWVQVAYALLPVSEAEMETLCQRWPFEKTKGGAA